MREDAGSSGAAAPRPAAPDFTTPPRLAATPALELPPIVRHRLSNGLEVVLVERHEIPVVDLDLVIRTGAAADAQAEAGRASLTAEMLDEGTAGYDALGLSEAVDFLGAELAVRATWDASAVSLHVLTPRLEPALGLLAEVVLRPAFPEDEFARVRDERLALLLRQQAEPGVLAARALARALYGAAHPYGAPVSGTRESIARLERDALVAFYRTHYRPDNAFLVAVGDVEAATLLPMLERALGAWAPPPALPVPPVDLPPPPARPGCVYLVDKPDAPQSEVRVGQPGPPRTTPDYFPLVVLNTILGGSFTSRLNLALREERGFSYGAGSRFEFRQGGGPFRAGSAVFGEVTDSALAVFIDEIRRIREEPIPEQELERARSYVALGLPRDLETTADIAAALAEIELYGLGDDYLARYVERVQAVGREDVERVAREHLDPDRMALVVVGDRARVEGPLRELGLGGVEVIEVD